MMTKPALSVYLAHDVAKERIDRLTELAVECGYLRPRGDGSTSALIDAVARGELVLLRAVDRAEMVRLLQGVHAKLPQDAPGRADVGAALRLLGCDPETMAEDVAFVVEPRANELLRVCPVCGQTVALRRKYTLHDGRRKLARVFLHHEDRAGGVCAGTDREYTWQMEADAQEAVESEDANADG